MNPKPRGRPKLPPEQRKPPKPRVRKPGESGANTAPTAEETEAARSLLSTAAAALPRADQLGGVWTSLARLLQVDGGPSLATIRQRLSDAWRGRRKLPRQIEESLTILYPRVDA
jgi:hypothetical protein